MDLKRKMNSVQTFLFISSFMFVVLLMDLKSANLVDTKFVSLGETKQLSLTTNNEKSTMNVTYVELGNYYEVFKMYDFFIPNVDVVCQCYCTDEEEEFCSTDRKCAELVNSTTTCTVYNRYEKNSAICSKYYKLCCQTYFSKTEMLKSFKALQLKYRKSSLKFSVTSKSLSGEIKTYNVTVTENVKFLRVDSDTVLHVDFIPEHLLPDAWYYVEDGSTELLHADNMNSIDELDMNKIGWFQYDDTSKQLSRVTREDLKRHLHVDLSDCLLNPSNYIWKLNASYYVSKGSSHLSQDVQKVAKLYNDKVSKISVNLKTYTVNVTAINHGKALIGIENVTFYPFIFTSFITATVLNLTFTKGSGNFDVEIKCPNWIDKINFFTASTETIINLPIQDYDSCWICVDQNSQQLCQIPSFIKSNNQSNEQWKTLSPIDVTNNSNFQNESLLHKNATLLKSENSSNASELAIEITGVLILLALLVTVAYIFLRRIKIIAKRMNVSGDESEMEPLSCNRSQGPVSNFKKYFDRNRSADIKEESISETMKFRLEAIQQRVEKIQRKAYRQVELPQMYWTERILPLEELYVDLEMFKTTSDHEESKGEPIKLDQLFDQVDGVNPVRILIEGGPGFGKTTLCFKLLNDWGRNRENIGSKFKMVFMFKLRLYKENDSIEEMLKRECETINIDGEDGINCIKRFEKETLLILDGFDEMNEECKQKLFVMIQNKDFSSMYIVVTSRTGMFQLENTMKIQHSGILKTIHQEKHFWNKRILVKGVTKDNIEIFMEKYLKLDVQELEERVHSIIQGEMREVLQCPLFLILLAMMLEDNALVNVNSKTTLYIEFFNFMIRRNLVRENKLSKHEKVDIINQSSENNWLVLLVKFGQMAINFLCQNKLMFDDKDIASSFSEETILQLGFLTKIPKAHGRKIEIAYQPIHKSFLEFVAAYAMWHLFKTDENLFKSEIERLGEKGLKPTNDSLFYVFLGGLMTSKAYVLFHCLTRYSLWFNIESICFTNILLEIKDISSFYRSFEPMLDPFIPSIHNINLSKGVNSEFFQSEIHSLILKHSSDRRLINVVWWNSKFSVRLFHELYLERLHLYVSNEVIQLRNENLIKCKNIVCQFSKYFEIDKWNDFLSLFNSIQSEKINFAFSSESNDMNSQVLRLLHQELTEGQWKEKTIDRVRFELNEFDDPHCLSFLVDLVKRNRIHEGVHLRIKKEIERTEEKIRVLKKETEELFNAVIQSGKMKTLFVYNYDDKCSPLFNFTRVINSNLKSFYFIGYFNLSISNRHMEKYTFETMRILSSHDEIELHFFPDIKVSKYLDCKLECFNSLVEREWRDLKKIEELALSKINPESLQLLHSVSKVTQLQVLTLDVSEIETISSEAKSAFINLFSLLNLRVCEFLYLQNLEVFSVFTEVLMEGLKNKKKGENNSAVASNERKKYYLQELVIYFDEIEKDFSQLKESNAIEWIQSMLRNKHLQECCWVDYYNFIKPDQLDHFFPSRKNFSIEYEMDGINSKSARRTQLVYHWFLLFDRYCIKYIQ